MAHILVVDDESMMRATVRMTLERTGYTVSEAGDGEAALALLSTNRIDAVLLDIRMPGLDGPETLSRIRAKDSKIPVIMVTGYGSSDSMQDVMDRGATHYISKPFKNKELLDVLAKWVTVEPVRERVIIPTEVPKPVSVPWGRMLIGLTLIGVIAGAAVVMWQRTIAPKVIVQDFALPYSNPTSLLWQDEKLWVLDWYTQSIYVHELRGNELPIVKTYHLPDGHITGMALVDGMLYTSNSWTKTISKHKLDNFLTVVARFPSPGPSPSGLFWDGKYLWCSDLGQNKIYQLQLNNTLLVVGSFPAPGTALAGFYKDDNYAWTADAQTRRLYQHRLNDQLTVIGVYSDDDFERGTEPLSSIVWHGDRLWFARDRRAVLSQRSRAALKSQDIQYPPR